MKRTTYIIIGMLLAGVVVMSGVLILMAKYGISSENRILNVVGELKTVQLSECKVVQIRFSKEVIETKANGIKEVRLVGFDNVPLRICPSDSVFGTFTYASDMDKYMEISQAGDTMRIKFSFHIDKLGDKYRDLRWMECYSKAMTLKLPVGVQRVTSNLVGQPVTFEKFDQDTLSFAVEGHATLNDCRFRALRVTEGSLNFNSGEVKDLHLYLDRIGSWRVNKDSFNIDTEYLYSHKNSRCTLDKGECRQVVWKPKSKDASLSIELKEAAKVIVAE